MAGDALVTYAGADQSVLEAAQIVARELSATRENVDVLPLRLVDDLDRYTAVILGSPVRNRGVLLEAVEFARRHREALGHVQIAYFLVGSGFDKSGEENRSLARRYLGRVQEAAPELSPLAIGCFHDLDHREFAAPDRVTRRRKWLPEAALHDWLAVRDWAAMLENVLAMTPRGNHG